MKDANWTGGLAPEQDLMFPKRPENPEMRESASVWLFEENGSFGFPRLGIEAEAASWDNRGYQANMAFADGSVLLGFGLGTAHSPLDAHARPSVLGAGPLMFRCVEPFRKWVVVYRGNAIESHVSQQLDKTLDLSKSTAVYLEAELTTTAPAWVQNNPPEKVQTMSAAQRLEAGYMGIGYRIEQLCRAEGQLRVHGTSRSFKAVGSRIHRQSVRPLEGFRGHCWQSAVFPNGNAFGYIAYPRAADGSGSYNEGYIYQDGRVYRAHAVKVPWLRRPIAAGDDVSLELQSELGLTRIAAVATLSTFSLDTPQLGGFDLHQGGARYTWGTQSAYGMIERSSHKDQSPHR